MSWLPYCKLTDSGEGVNRLTLFFQRSLSAWGQVNAALYAQVLVCESRRQNVS